MCCDECDEWVHVTCDVNITDAEYNNLVDNPVTDLWYCTACLQSRFSVSDESMADTQLCSDTPLLHCLYLNARSILNKRLDLTAYLASHNPDIVAITETFLDSTVPSYFISPSTYSMFRKDRSRHGGGVLLLVHSSIQCNLHLDLDSISEILWIELHSSVGPILFGVYYRPPSESSEQLTSLQHSLSCLPPSCPVVCVGILMYLISTGLLFLPACLHHYVVCFVILLMIILCFS